MEKSISWYNYFLLTIKLTDGNNAGGWAGIVVCLWATSNMGSYMYVQSTLNQGKG
jgi:hypothetical protein